MNPKYHPRLLVGAAIGFAAWLLATVLGAPLNARALIGWNVGACAYLIAAWRLYVTATAQDVCDRAARQDEGRGAILALAVLAVTVSFAGIVAALAPVNGQTAAQKVIVEALAALTLVSSWLVMQSLFVAHYAHRHFEDIKERGEEGGFLFPGDAPTTYLDFAYLALCVGATAQVSDPGVKTRKLRNLVTAHAVTAFFYNTAVLALGINILSGLLGH